MSGGSLLGKGLPYDAEIEYLESQTGYEYIDTHVQMHSNYGGYELKVVPTNDTRVNPFGTRDNSSPQTNAYEDILRKQENKYSVDCAWYNQWYTRCIVISPLLNNTFVIRRVGRTVTVNGSSYTCGNYNFTTQTTAILFCGQGYRNGVLEIDTNAGFTQKIYYLKIFDANQNLILDWIPVRVGNVGYMYDKVSGKLFGNSGTGDFILGPDKH